jgi:hypothetical protein
MSIESVFREAAFIYCIYNRNDQHLTEEQEEQLLDYGMEIVAFAQERLQKNTPVTRPIQLLIDLYTKGTAKQEIASLPATNLQVKTVQLIAERFMLTTEFPPTLEAYLERAHRIQTVYTTSKRKITPKHAGELLDCTKQIIVIAQKQLNQGVRVQNSIQMLIALYKDDQATNLTSFARHFIKKKGGTRNAIQALSPICDVTKTVQFIAKHIQRRPPQIVLPRLSSAYLHPKHILKRTAAQKIEENYTSRERLPAINVVNG